MTNLPATLQGMTEHEMAVVMGVAQDDKNYLPVLRINYQKSRDVDGTKVKLTKGVWTISNGEVDVYGTDLSTIILLASYQVREWDAAKDEYAAETIFFQKGWDEKCEDTAGGYRCGKLKSKALEDIHDEDILAAQRNKKFYRVLWGLATLHGEDMHGNKASAENVPFIMRVRGQGFMPLCNYIDSFKKGEELFNYETTWEIEEGEHATTDFWIPKAVRGKKGKGLADPNVGEVLPHLLQWREEHNKDVLAKYDKANGLVAGLPAEESNMEVIDAVVVDDDHDDEIPF